MPRGEVADHAQPRPAAVVEVAFAGEVVTVPALTQAGGTDGLERWAIGYEPGGLSQQGDHLLDLGHVAALLGHDAEDAVSARTEEREWG